MLAKALSFAVLLLVVAAAAIDSGGAGSIAHAEGSLEVTSVADTGLGGGAVCPDATLCTLRRAIEVANADVGTTEFRIKFSPAVFPPNEPGIIEVGNTPLPNIARSGVTIDGSASGVVLRDAASSLSGSNNGLTVTGPNFTVQNIRVTGFRGTCISITGSGATIGGPGSGVAVGGCAAGIGVSGAGAIIRGNLVGFSPDGEADPMDTGIVAAAGGIRVGGPASLPGAGNTIGYVATGIFVGAGTEGPFTGVEIERNLIGQSPGGSAAPVTNGVVLSQPSSSTLVLDNHVSNAKVGIVVGADSDGVAVVRNTFTGNIFGGISGMAIDLGADGVTNLNDAGDIDTGPNGMLNHPVISRATQTRVSGTACVGCAVQIYVAAHEPGGTNDYGLAPLSGGTVTADGAGQFALDNPAAAPGDWLIALASDADGNTSEFGPSARVGAGSVLCGNIQLHAGWNHVGYFGSEPVSLLASTFSPVPSGAVSAVYHFIDGSEEFERWFASTTVGRTLTTVQPGESYWFFAEAPATLPGGFSLSFPLPVELKAGWNDFVYLGASEEATDALSSIRTGFRDLYKFDTTTAKWLRFGGSAVPSWAQQFSRVEACSVYQLRLDAPVTLVPLQP